jgi:hypothetical protein
MSKTKKNKNRLTRRNQVRRRRKAHTLRGSGFRLPRLRLPRLPSLSSVKYFFTRKKQPGNFSDMMKRDFLPEKDYQTYCNQFFVCKKRMFDRLFKRGECKNLSHYSFNRSDYLLSEPKYDQLMDLIKKRINEILTMETENPKWIQGVANYIRTKEHRIVNKAIGDFYVSTYLMDPVFDERQEIRDIRTEENHRPPEETDFSVVYPAYLYLTKQDMEVFKEYYNASLRSILDAQNNVRETTINEIHSTPASLPSSPTDIPIEVKSI